MCKCANVQMCKCANAQMLKCSNRQMLKCSNAKNQSDLDKKPCVFERSLWIQSHARKFQYVFCLSLVNSSDIGIGIGIGIGISIGTGIGIGIGIGFCKRNETIIGRTRS